MSATEGLPVPRTAAGRAGLAALRREPRRALVALDYDGTLAPIVADPALAAPHPRALAVLGRLAARVGSLAVITGRPAAVVTDLAGFAGAAGLEHLVVFGHYGAERWDAAGGTVRARPPHPGVGQARAALPALLAAARAKAPEVLAGCSVEDKGASLAVHTRGARDPAAALEALRGPLAGLAERCGLRLEPGRYVLELRPGDVDKGVTLLAHARDVGARAVAYAGDDLGDLAAFAAVESLRGLGVPGLSVAVASAETTEPQAGADLVVAGPDGLLALLHALADLDR